MENKTNYGFISILIVIGIAIGTMGTGAIATILDKMILNNLEESISSDISQIGVLQIGIEKQIYEKCLRERLIDVENDFINKKQC